MGFNNQGVDYLVDRVQNRRYQGVLGINIGKNKATPEERALDDYRTALTAVYPYADYVTVNISSPNTPGLRDLQFGQALSELLSDIDQTRLDLAQEHDKNVPIAVKIAPDMTFDEVQQVAQTIAEHNMDGVIATNTTLDKSKVDYLPYGDETGGLSGAPVTEKSTQVIQWLSETLGPDFPIIGVGGIMSDQDALDKLAAGAKLVQIYTGFIYRGPSLIKEINRALA